MPENMSVFVGPVAIDTEVADLLAEVAYERGQTVTALVREILAAYSEGFTERWNELTQGGT